MHNKQNIDLLISSSLAFYCIILLTSHGGVGISPDSIYYYSTAKNATNFNQWVQFDNQPLVIFPLCYPLFLQLFIATSTSHFFQAMPFINASMFASIVFLSGKIIKNVITIVWVRYAVLVVIVLSPVLLEVYSMLWSETLFIFLVVLFIFFGDNYQKKSNNLYFFLLIVITALACVTRFIGVTLIPIGLCIITTLPNLGFSLKIKRAILFSLGSSFLLILNLVRNYIVRGTLTGTRQAGQFHFIQQSQNFINVICHWFCGYQLPSFVLFTLASVACIVVVYSFFKYFFFKRTQSITISTIHLYFILIYSVCILVLATMSRFEPLNNRLLSPLFIPIVISTGILFQRILLTAINYKNLLSISMALLFVFIQVHQAKQVATFYQENKEGGIGGYGEDSWKESPLIAFLKSNNQLFASKNYVRSNAAHAVYFFTNHACALLPEKVHKNEVAQFYNQIREKGNGIIIWFDAEQNKDLLSMEEIQEKLSFRITKRFSDGYILQYDKGKE